MALTTDRISVLRGRPPMRAGGRRGFRTAHCWLVRSLGYGFGFIPFLRSRPPFGTDSHFSKAESTLHCWNSTVEIEEPSPSSLSKELEECYWDISHRTRLKPAYHCIQADDLSPTLGQDDSKDPEPGCGRCLS